MRLNIRKKMILKQNQNVNLIEWKNSFERSSYLAF